MTVGLMRGRPKVMAVLAMLLISAGLTFGLAREAVADYLFTFYNGCCGAGLRDGDGFVPESPGTPKTGSYDLTLGFAYGSLVSTPNGYAVARWIEYDWAEMNRCGATDIERQRLRLHERAHSRGWRHGEGPASLNAAYYENIAGVYC